VGGLLPPPPRGGETPSTPLKLIVAALVNLLGN
jgi:hypothetical protein